MARRRGRCVVYISTVQGDLVRYLDVQLPGRGTKLDTSLAHVNVKNLAAASRVSKMPSRGGVWNSFRGGQRGGAESSVESMRQVVYKRVAEQVRADIPHPSFWQDRNEDESKKYWIGDVDVGTRWISSRVLRGREVGPLEMSFPMAPASPDCSPSSNWQPGAPSLQWAIFLAGFDQQEPRCATGVKRVTGIWYPSGRG